MPDNLDRYKLFVYGLILLFLPVLFIGFTLSFLQFSGAVALGELSALELVELYVIELVLFGGLIYGLYLLAERFGRDAL
ncbi:hypothetical protein [Halorientalis pallida]|uniref:Uncharacterized protein n=1 Tax=Halorientalis pallida TaxID=2479928 RepID=A0A498L6S9_9EURY|nr:hypothetical protein [Halorientalis pallida]RXK50415.1 hypothetical protein EAF64_07635 [Halorientalis pallida]